MRRTSHGALVVPLRPVEERFARALPGQLQQMTTAVYVLDGAGLRDTAGRLDFPAVRGHLTWWLRAHEYNATRLVSSALGLTPPAWVSAAEPLDRAIELWPHPCGAAEVDSLVAALQQVPIDLRTSPVHVTVVDDPAGPVVLVLRASHAWTDGLLGLHILQQLTGGQPGPLHTPPHDPPVTGPLGPVALALSLLRMWWADQPSWRAAARSWLSRSPKDRARRVLGRQRWTLALSLARLRRSAVPVTPELGLHRLELPLDTVSRYARACGGNVNELLAVAVSHAVAAAGDGNADGGAQLLHVPMSDRPAAGAVAANRIRVVTVQVDPAQPLEESVPAVRQQLRAPAHATAGPARAHATTLVGPRQELWFGPAAVEQVALMPSLGADEDFGALALIRRRTVVVSLATRRPENLPAFAESLAATLTGNVVEPIGAHR